jgi:endonuclease/exonuclease/phosphatase family metal-dependent hydrolase
MVRMSRTSGPRRRLEVTVAPTTLLLTALLLTASILTGCTAGPAPAPGGSAAGPATAAGPMPVRIMEFNIEYGGTTIDFASIVAAVKRARPDVLLVEEGYGHIPRLAHALGWKNYDARTQVLSRWPLLNAGDGTVYDYVQVAPGSVFAVANAHLPSAPYGPLRAQNGGTVAQVLATERVGRLPEIQQTLATVAPVVGAGTPTVLGGDFNTPSHLDWTPATVGRRPQIIAPIDWPVGEAVEAAGFVDSYRTLHPDPVTDPGLTWPANRPDPGGYNPFSSGAPRDRIDFVYLAHAQPTSSQVVGEPGTPGVDITVPRWGSDHRAMLTVAELRPVAAPALVSPVERAVGTGQDITVVYDTATTGPTHLTLRPTGDQPAVPTTPVVDLTEPDGSATVSTTGLPAGQYLLSLTADDGTQLASAPVYIEAADRPRLVVAGSVLAPGQPIGVAWYGAAGNRWDWIGLYRHHADPNNASYLGWFYTGATIDGTGQLDQRSQDITWPLRPGRYTVYLLVDDSYRQVASADFTVTRAG